ncbi:MAG: HAD family phosphatase [Clostridia bacterium]|nr:HAD family phosphatase [Clostridia bacterium]
MSFKYAVFDMDGTLLDTMDYWRDIVRFYAEMHSLPIPVISEKDAIAASHLSTYKKIAFLKERYGEQEAVKLIGNEDVFDVMEYFYKKAPKIRFGVVEMLESLKANGVRMCVASATPSYPIEIALKTAGLSDYFEFVLSPTEYPKGKSDPDIFYGVAERFGCDVTEVALFEDTLYSIKTAHNLGMYIIAVRDKYSAYQADEIKANSNEYYTEFTEYKYK